MAGTDGRISPGQSLATAISAKAWNRAQDAADIVLGQRNQFAAPDAEGPFKQVVVPCSVSSTVNNVRPGFVVKISGASGVTPVAGSANDNRVARATVLSGEVIQPVSLSSYQDAKVQLGVIVGGSVMPKQGTPAVVYVCIAGMCVARVRLRYQNQSINLIGRFQFLQGPVTRPGDNASDLIGAAESSSCGSQRIIASIGSASGVLSHAVVIL